MTAFLLTLLLVASAAAVWFSRAKKRAEQALANEQLRASAESRRLTAEAASANQRAQDAFEVKVAELHVETKRMHEHYETEARKAIEEVQAELTQARTELEPLRALAALRQSETEVRATLADALAEATALRAEAKSLVEHAREAAAMESKAEQRRAKELYAQAEALLAQASRDAGRIVSEAETRARQIGGDAYTALQDKQALEQAVKAIRNVIEGYGDRYIIPTHSLLDQLAADFSHTAAGESLRMAREQSRRMVEEGQAAGCDYVETNRRETAIRFVTDAFNGRVDAILSRAKHDNHGTLEQEIRDTFGLVNLNGEAFRKARVLPSYCDARLAELRWAVVVNELKLKEREEQRRIQEQIREEEKVRRECERAIQEAAKEEDIIRKAMEKAQTAAAAANAQERTKFEAQLAELSQKLAEAEAKNQRALSMAQQTRSGHVYIISNAGSFGIDVVKIGMTRRLKPEDRIWELSDASVPFDFDVHAMIKCDDAPTLERELHARFDELRVNKVNYRKEFFRVSVQLLKDFVAEKKLEATFTLAAEAREYRETQALEKMSPEERRKYQLHESESDATN